MRLFCVRNLFQKKVNFFTKQCPNYILSSHIFWSLFSLSKNSCNTYITDNVNKNLKGQIIFSTFSLLFTPVWKGENETHILATIPITKV